MLAFIKAVAPSENFYSMVSEYKAPLHPIYTADFSSSYVEPRPPVPRRTAEWCSPST